MSVDQRSQKISADLLELQWVQRIADGDEKSFEAMVLAYGAKLARFVWHFVKSTDVAEELVQEVFCNIWEQRQTWSPKQSVKSYLYTAVRNQAIGYLRHRRFETLWEGEDESIVDAESASLDEAVHTTDFAKAIQQAVEDLPERCRIIFRLHREDGLTYVEIAEILGISKKTVETQMGRALRVLRSRLVHFLPVFVLFSGFHNHLS